MTLHFKTVITVIVIESAVSYLFFLYQALQRPHQFRSHTGGIALHAETGIHLHRLEVRSEAAVVLTRYSNVLAYVDVRVARGQNWKTKERE